jgi:hypothetical protein
MDSYNGFSSHERTANGIALRKALKAGTVPLPIGPCALCCDPNVDLEYHSEDYSKPYNWSPPAAYPLCRTCHRNKLHKRFANPVIWEAFKAHVRRGGYASDLKNAQVTRELEQYVAANREGIALNLRIIRPYPHVIGSEWWDRLSVNNKPNLSSSGRAEARRST